MNLRNTLHLLMAIPCLLGLIIVGSMTWQAKSDVPGASFPRDLIKAYGDLATNFPATPLSVYAEIEEQTDVTLETLNPELAVVYAANNAFLISIALLALAGVVGIALMGVAKSTFEPLYCFPLRCGAVACLGLVATFLIGFGIAYPGDFNGYLGFGGVALSPGLDSVEYGMNGMTHGTDLLFFAAYAALGATLLMSLSIGTARSGPILLIILFFVAITFPLAVSWKWGGGWLQQSYDFAGAALLHWHVGSLAIIIGLAGMIRRNFRRGTAPPIGVASSEMKPPQTVFYLCGSALVYLALLALNSGSVLVATPSAVLPVLQNSIVASLVAGALAIGLWALTKRQTAVEMLSSGLFAGVISVSGNTDTIGLGGAILCGLMAGILVQGVIVVSDLLGVSDPLSIGAIFGIGGAIGTLAVTFVGTDAIPAKFVWQIIMLLVTPLLSIIGAISILAISGAAGFLNRDSKNPSEDLRQLPPQPIQ